MSVRLNPYLNFRGNAREAMTFYRDILGGNLRISTFREFGMTGQVAEAELDHTMHAQLDTEGGLTLMASDVPSSMPFEAGGNQFAVSLSGDEEAELTGYYDSLSQGGHVLQPLASAPWGDAFGMVRDRFGVTWMVNIAGQRPQ